jgi:transcriptional regulator with XRE-family HTH domain
VANWSLRDVAWYLGLSVSLLSDIERGYAQPLDRTVITRLAAEWQIDPTPLLGALQRQDDDSFAQTDSEEETPDAP